MMPISYTKEDDSYILENWYSMKAAAIALKLSKSSPSLSYRAIHVLGLTPKSMKRPHGAQIIFREKEDENSDNSDKIKCLLARPSWFNEPGFKDKLTHGR